MGCTNATYAEHNCSTAHAPFIFTGLALAGAAFGWTRHIDRPGSVVSLSRSGLCGRVCVCVWFKMEGNPGARSGARCSIDTGTMRHTSALTIRDALTQTFVTDSELY